MIKVSHFSLLLASAMFAAACGDSSGPDSDSGVQLKDQGVIVDDGGVNNDPDGGNNNTPDSGNNNTPDSGNNNPDSGTPAGCNPVTGGNCPQDQTCRLQLSAPAGPVCREPIGGPVAYGASCAGAPDSCAPGLTCLDPGDGAICLKICDAGNNGQCAGVGNDPNGYSCLGPLQAAPSYGVCVANLPSCIPWNDMCVAGQYCEYTGGSNNFGCVPEGTSQPGAACTQQNPCMKGGMCLNLGQGAQCQKPCDPQGGTGCTPNTEVCIGLIDQNNQPLPFGVCDDAPEQCSPLNDTCPGGQYCQAYQDGNFCVAEGAANVGQACSAQNLCKRGAVCGQNAQQQVVCMQVCDTAANPSTCPGNPPAACADTGAGFGVCG